MYLPSIHLAAMRAISQAADTITRLTRLQAFLQIQSIPLEEINAQLSISDSETENRSN